MTEKKEVVLSPIEVAIDEMTAKVIDIREVVDLVMPDMKKLQLRLQGGVSAQVGNRSNASVTFATVVVRFICLRFFRHRRRL